MRSLHRLLLRTFGVRCHAVAHAGQVLAGVGRRIRILRWAYSVEHTGVLQHIEYATLPSKKYEYGYVTFLYSPTLLTVHAYPRNRMSPRLHCRTGNSLPEPAW